MAFTADTLAEMAQAVGAEIAVPDIPDEPFKVRLRNQPVFATGIDMDSPEEQEKRRQRALKYNIPNFYPLAVQGADLNKMDFDSPELAEKVAQAEEDARRKEEREKKFGAAVVALDTDVKGPERATLDTAADLDSPRRWDTLHLFGTKIINENMKTNDIFRLFDNYGPQAVEWISGVRCNVQFPDEFGARRALRSLSNKISAVPPPDYENKLAALGAIGGAADFEFVAWRLAHVHEDGATLLMRIATTMDVKPPLEERKKSGYLRQYYKQNYSEIKKQRQKRAQREQRAEEQEAEAQALAAAQPKEVDLSSGRKVVLKPRQPGELQHLESAAAAAGEEGTTSTFLRVPVADGKGVVLQRMKKTIGRVVVERSPDYVAPDEAASAAPAESTMDQEGASTASAASAARSSGDDALFQLLDEFRQSPVGVKRARDELMSASENFGADLAKRLNAGKVQRGRGFATKATD